MLVFAATALIGFAAFSARKALDQRAVAVEATDLRLAVLTVASADERPTDTAEFDRLASAVERLSGDHDVAFGGLTDVQRSAVETDLQLIAGHGEMLADHGHVMAGGEHSLAAHGHLEESLRTAALNSVDSAARNEGRAALSGLAALGALAAGLWRWLSLRSRAKSMQTRADALQEASSRFEWLLNDSPEASLIISRDGDISYQAASVAAFFPDRELGNRDDLVELTVDAEQSQFAAHLQSEGTGRRAMAFRVAGSDTDPDRNFVAQVSDLRGDALIDGWLVSLRDVSAETAAQRQLESRVRTDDLTGLPNRRALMEDLHRIAGAATTFDFLMIDLDDFKMTNDTFGHKAGDELLSIVARRLEGALVHGDRLYRLGGDEFAVIVGDTDSTPSAALAERLLTDIATPIRLTVGFERATASIGIATREPDGDPMSIVHRADIALYEAKKRGGNAVQVVHSELEKNAERRREMGRALHDANLNEFWLVYQPIVDGATGRTVMVEALLRWQSPAIGFVGPDQFIPLAEQSGRIVELGLWVLETACAQLASWRAQGDLHGVGVTVNVSPRQLQEQGFDAEVLAIIERHNVDPSDVTIEVTESALVAGQGEIVHALASLRAVDVRVACDDFGSGYSNLGQLMALPLDMIKVDRGLLLRLNDMRESAGGSHEAPCEVMAAIVQIADVMGVPVVAEGIETAVQQASLVASGVQLQQGYYFSKPAANSEIPLIVEQSTLQNV